MQTVSIRLLLSRIERNTARAIVLTFGLLSLFACDEVGLRDDITLEIERLFSTGRQQVYVRDLIPDIWDEVCDVFPLVRPSERVVNRVTEKYDRVSGQVFYTDLMADETSGLIGIDHSTRTYKVYTVSNSVISLVSERSRDGSGFCADFDSAKLVKRGTVDPGIIEISLMGGISDRDF